MSNKLVGMYLMASLLMACGATHDVGEQLRGASQEESGDQGDTPKACSLYHSDCNPSTEVCDIGVCRTGCGSNYPGADCGQGAVCDDYICRPTCTAGCPSGTTCDQPSNICRPSACSANSPCPANYGCENGACIPVGRSCSAQYPCSSDQTCVQGVCQMWCGPNYPGHTCPTGQQCQPNAICG